MEFCQVQNSLCVQVLPSHILAVLLHGTPAVAGWPLRWVSAHILVMVALWNGKDHYILILWFLLMVALWNRADHYIFMLWFALSSFFFFLFFPRLISAAADWMSAILPHMVWP